MDAHHFQSLVFPSLPEFVCTHLRIAAVVQETQSFELRASFRLRPYSSEFIQNAEMEGTMKEESRGESESARPKVEARDGRETKEQCGMKKRGSF